MKKGIIAVFTAVIIAGAAPVSALGAWYDGSPLIAHCLGEADGKIETNSKEAFIESWGSGFRVMEADFTYTSDGTLVVRHDFEKDGSYYRLEQDVNGSLVMDSATYQSSKIVYEQTPMTAADLFSLLVEYNDVYLVTDTKDTDKETVVKQFTDIKRIAENMGYPEILQRIVPQVYNKEMYGWIKDIYPFEEWIYTLYLDSAPDYQDIAEFCSENGIGTVTIEKDRATAAAVSALRSGGVKVYAHTINRYQQLEELLALGVDGVYTDRIKPYELEWVGLSDSRRIVSKTCTIGTTEATLDTITLLGEDYVSLRQLGNVGKGFSAQYDRDNKQLKLTSGKKLTTIGNELLLNDSGRLITEKADFSIYYDNKPISVRSFFIDGEVFVPLAAMAQLMA